MTKLLERAIEAARTLSPSEQDDIARVIIQLSGLESPELNARPLSEQREELRTMLDATEAEGGSFSTDEVRRYVREQLEKSAQKSRGA